jgi:coenzyme F420-reducing hydrogenase delta subunit
MKNSHPQIIAFTCNWAPFACLDKLGIRGDGYPQGINIVQVTCAGRINTSHMVNAFLHGADGVMMLHCRDGHCQYGPGPSLAKVNIDKTIGILQLLGIEPERFTSLAYLPDEEDKLKEDLERFHKVICNLKPFKKKYM